MTHDRINLARHVIRLNLGFWVTGIECERVRLDAALEITTYQTDHAFAVVDAEGLFFTMSIDNGNWGQEMYQAVQRRLAYQYRAEQRQWDCDCRKKSGDLVIPDKKLSTAPQGQ